MKSELFDRNKLVGVIDDPDPEDHVADGKVGALLELALAVLLYDLLAHRLYERSEEATKPHDADTFAEPVQPLAYFWGSVPRAREAAPRERTKVAPWFSAA